MHMSDASTHGHTHTHLGVAVTRATGTPPPTGQARQSAGRAGACHQLDTHADRHSARGTAGTQCGAIAWCQRLAHASSDRREEVPAIAAFSQPSAYHNFPHSIVKVPHSFLAASLSSATLHLPVSTALPRLAAET